MGSEEDDRKETNFALALLLVVVWFGFWGPCGVFWKARRAAEALERAYPPPAEEADRE